MQPSYDEHEKIKRNRACWHPGNGCLVPEDLPNNGHASALRLDLFSFVMPQLQHPTSLRTPTPSKSRTLATASTSAKTSSTPAKARAVQAKSPVKPKPTVSHSKAPETEKPIPALSIKEAIALKRAEAKKSGDKSARGALSTFGGLDDAPAVKPDSPVQDEDNLGRLSLRQAIDRARSTGKRSNMPVTRTRLINKGLSGD